MTASTKARCCGVGLPCVAWTSLSIILQRFTGNQILKISQTKPAEYAATEVCLCFHCSFCLAGSMPGVSLLSRESHLSAVSVLPSFPGLTLILTTVMVSGCVGGCGLCADSDYSDGEWMCRWVWSVC